MTASKAKKKCPECGHPLMADLRDFEVWCANCHYSRPARKEKA